MLNNLKGLLVAVTKFAVVSTTGVFGLGITLLVTFQEKLVYVPSLPNAPKDRYDYLPDNAHFRLGYEDVWLTTKDGVKLHSWMCYPALKPLASAPTIVFFQENAGNISHRLQNIKYFIEQLSCNVFILSYRGYGKSGGAPNEKGLKLDAEAALEHLQQRKDIDTSRLVVFGRSLGGAVAAALLVSHPAAFRAAILENTFTSIPDMAAVLMPFLRHLLGRGKPLNSLVRNKWSTVDLISEVVTPTMFISSGRDEMVPPAHMAELWARKRSPRSVLLEFPKGRHMDTWATGGHKYWRGMESFLRDNGCYPEGHPKATAPAMGAM